MMFILYLPVFLFVLWVWTTFSDVQASLLRKVRAILNPPKVSKGTYLPPHTEEAEEYARVSITPESLRK